MTGFDVRGWLPRRSASRARVRTGPEGLHRGSGRNGVSGGTFVGAVHRGRSARRSGAVQLRMIVVAGPRIDPDALPRTDGLEVRAFVPDLYRHLTACDIGVVQGGLTTSMELTTNGRPFLYFPLGHHFEQNFHVRHRLDRYRAGRCIEFASATPESDRVGLLPRSWARPTRLPAGRDRRRRAPPRTSPSCFDMAGVDSPTFPATFGFLCELIGVRPSGSRGLRQGAPHLAHSDPVGDGAATPAGLRRSCGIPRSVDRRKATDSVRRPRERSDCGARPQRAAGRSRTGGRGAPAHRVGADRAPGNCRRFVRA